MPASANADVVPLRRQYLQIKERFPDTILFFRLGDFYETFDGDAHIASDVLDIVLTGREMGKNLRVPMAGIPFHAAEGYIARLIAAVREVPEIGRYLLRLDDEEVALAFHPRPGANATLVRFLLHDLSMRHPGRRLPNTEVQLALHEALANALEHGNLGITYEEKTAAMETSGGVRALVDQRLCDERLAARMAHVRVIYAADEVAYMVRDEGSGFDARCRTHEPMAAATALHGRGLKLIQHVMDDVRWNPAGTEITMGKRLDGPGVLGEDDDEDDEDDRDLDDDRVPGARGRA